MTDPVTPSPDASGAVDEAPQIPGDFGVDSDPYTKDDSQGQYAPALPEPEEA